MTKTASIFPSIMSLMLDGITDNLTHETMGFLFGTKDEDINVTGVAFSRLEDYSLRTESRATVIPRSSAIEPLLVPGQQLIGFVHDHPSNMAFHSSVDDAYFKQWPRDSLSVVVGKNIQTYMRTEKGGQLIPLEICWKEPREVFCISQLEWKVPALITHPKNLDSVFMRARYENEMVHIARTKAQAPSETWIIYVDILGLMPIRIARPRNENIGELSAWIERLLGYDSIGKIRLILNGRLLPLDMILHEIPELSCVHGKLAVLR